MIPLGKIVRLQVQTANLKVGTGPSQRYDNTPLMAVAALDLDSGGAWGVGPDGERIADIHHRDHPQTKLREMINPISFSFTGHYHLMRDQFGQHLVDGAAAETILIEADAQFRLQDVIHGIWIEQPGGALVHLDGVSVAAPCAPFSRWALQFPDSERPDARVTRALQFLHEGMRGFYCRLGGPDSRIAVGNMVYVSA